MVYPTQHTERRQAIVVGFIIVLNGISNYKVACDDVRMGVDNRAFFY